MKSRLATAGLYSGFFAFSFGLCLFLTFDARIIGSQLEKAARGAGIGLSFEQAKMSGLMGLELRGVEISALNKPDSRPLNFRRLKLSPRLSSLPGMMLDARKKKSPRVAFSFSGWLADGGQRNLGGQVDLRSPAMEVDLDLAALPLEQLPTGLIRSFPPLTGKLNARLRLDVPDRQKPETWKGSLKTDLFQSQLGDFFLPQMAGMKVPGFNLGNAALELEFKGGNGVIKEFRLTEGDLIVDLNGSFSLPKAPPVTPGAITVQLTGTLNMTDENKKKLPMISTIIPPNGRLNYSGELRAISPMLSAGAPAGASPSPPAAPAAPAPGFDPLADPFANP